MTSRTVAAAEAFLGTLDDAQREQASFAFDSDKKSNWCNFPAPLVERNTVAFVDMTKEQQQAAVAILQTALSQEGYKKAVDIIAADQALASEKGQPDINNGGLTSQWEDNCERTSTSSVRAHTSRRSAPQLVCKCTQAAPGGDEHVLPVYRGGRRRRAKEQE